MRIRTLLTSIVIALALTGCRGAVLPSSQPSVSAPQSFSGQARAGLAERIIYTFKRGPAVGALIADKAGALYGTGGGSGSSPDWGVVFKLTRVKSGYAFRVLHRFQGAPRDGGNPFAGLVADGAGNFYGTTAVGGAYDNGTVFKLSPKGKGYAETVLHSFDGSSGDGYYPRAPLVIIGRALYGTASEGGSSSYYGQGTVFTVTRDGANYRILHTFKGWPTDGTYPQGAPLADRFGNLYGTAAGGGAPGCGYPGCGTVWKLTRSGSTYTESILYSFLGKHDGDLPVGALIADGDGALYGTTASGGSAGDGGTVFRLRPSKRGYIESVIHSFHGDDGWQPAVGLTWGHAGTLYGTTSVGGLPPCTCGTVFRLQPLGRSYTETVVHSFEGGRWAGHYRTGPDGANPYGEVLLLKGSLYGTTNAGGRPNLGVVYELSP